MSQNLTSSELPRDDALRGPTQRDLLELGSSDISSIIDFVVKHQATRIALQFGDSVLHQAAGVCTTLQNAFEENGLHDHFCFILADTSFGDEAVDEVAAAHMNADAIIHFGDAEVQATSSLPVHYCFPTSACKDDQLAECFASIGSHVNSNNIILLYDSCFTTSVNRVHQDQSLRWRLYEPVSKRVSDDEEPENNTETLAACVYVFRLKLHAVAPTSPVIHIASKFSDSPIIGIEVQGDGSCLLVQLANCGSLNLSFHERPATGYFQTFMRERFALIQKARSADCFGVVATTLTSKGYEMAVESLRNYLEAAGKTVYVLLVGKLAPYKLANFDHIECFVLVGAASGTILNRDQQREYPAPVISPWEALLAAAPFIPGAEQTLAWDGTLSHNLHTIANVATSVLSQTAAAEADDTPIFNAATGKLHQRAQEHDAESTGNSSLMNRRPAQLMKAASASTRLNDREWQGMKFGVDTEQSSLSIEDGLHGIASQYRHEK